MSKRVRDRKVRTRFYIPGSVMESYTIVLEQYPDVKEGIIGEFVTRLLMENLPRFEKELEETKPHAN